MGNKLGACFGGVLKQQRNKNGQEGGNSMVLAPLHNAVSSNTMDDSVEIVNGELVNSNGYELLAETGSDLDGKLVMEINEQSLGHTNCHPFPVPNTMTCPTQDSNSLNIIAAPRGSVSDGNLVIENNNQGLDHMDYHPLLVPNTTTHPTQDSNLRDSGIELNRLGGSDYSLNSKPSPIPPITPRTHQEAENVTDDSASESEMEVNRSSDIDSSYSTTSQIPHLTDDSEPTIKMMTYGYQMAIAGKLDNLCHNNFKDAGMKLCESYGNESGLQKDEIQTLHLNYCGGGNPSYELLMRITTEQPSLKLSSFVATAKKLRRTDIANIISKWSENKELLIDLNEDELKSLALLLGKENVMNDWRNFADEFQFSNEDINAIERSIKTGKSSPTKALLELISVKNPNFKLRDLREVLKDIGRNDVVEVLTPIIDSCKKKMIKEESMSAELTVNS